MAKNYKFLEHTADVKFQAFGSSLDKAFENSASAVIEVITRKKKIPQKIKKSIKITGTDSKSLLYNFIEEILYLIDAENFITAKTKVKISGLNLSATLSGDKADKYSLDIVKAPTYAEMFIKQSKGKNKSKFTIQMVVDV